MEKHLHLKNDIGMKKRALIFSGIFISLFVLVSSTASACSYAYITNMDNVTHFKSAAYSHSLSYSGNSQLDKPMPNGIVSVIDTATNNIVANLSVGKFPVGVAATSDGKTVYVTNAYSDTVSVINTATNTVTSTVNVGEYPIGIAVEGNYVYVANDDNCTVSIINRTTNTVTSTLNVGDGPSGIASTQNYVYVASYIMTLFL